VVERKALPSKLLQGHACKQKSGTSKDLTKRKVVSFWHVQDSLGGDVQNRF
jgi:hypothetical protein